MTLLRELFENGQAGLTVYSPDGAQSRLWGNLDHTIHAATGFQVVRRQWINHDINSILRFYHDPGSELPPHQDPLEAKRKYESVPAEALQPGHLVVRLLLMGPSLITIWRGENAIAELLRAKGKTQPAESDAGTIRGGFWCDNGVCNLVHSSDSLDEAKRELQALNLETWLDEVAGHASLMEPVPLPYDYIPHSGIAVVAEAVRRFLLVRNTEFSPPSLPPSGDAKETNLRFTLHLRETAARHPETSPFIEAFLDGDVVALAPLLQAFPMTPWEQFAILCGAVNRDRWNAARAD